MTDEVAEGNYMFTKHVQVIGALRYGTPHQTTVRCGVMHFDAVLPYIISYVITLRHVTLRNST